MSTNSEIAKRLMDSLKRDGLL
ncbi:Arc family DNA-binding protein [Salmonella enterica subsp. enterica]|nr:Arc family DNA-binding protein [Salmonella enterica subsp. enterica]